MMKKRVRNLGVMICVLCMVIGSFRMDVIASEIVLSGGEILEELYEDNMNIGKMDDQTIQLLGELYDVYCFVEEEMKEQVSIATNVTNDTNDIVYKDYYAGAYIDGNNLVVCVTDKKEAAKDSPAMYALENNSLQKMGGIPEKGIISDENIQYKSVKYSYNELSETQDYFEDRYEEICNKYKEDTLEYQLLHSINGFLLRQTENSLIVSITDITDEKIAMFKSLFGEYEYVTFENSETPNIEETALRPGRPVYFKRDNGNVQAVSMGYRAKRTTSTGTQYGFVTCAHILRGLKDRNLYKGNQANVVVGTARTKKYGGAVDASFYEFAPGYTGSKYVKYTDANGGTSKTGTDVIGSSYFTYLPENYPVVKVGRTTFRTTGRIVSNNVSLTDKNGVSFSNLTTASYKSEGGDSGGIIYAEYLNTDTNVRTNCVVGVHRGRHGKNGVFSKVTEIKKALNVEPY